MVKRLEVEYWREKRKKITCFSTLFYFLSSMPSLALAAYFSQPNPSHESKTLQQRLQQRLFCLLCVVVIALSHCISVIFYFGASTAALRRCWVLDLTTHTKLAMAVEFVSTGHKRHVPRYTSSSEQYQAITTPHPSPSLD